MSSGSNTITAGKFSFSEQGFLCDLEPRCTQAMILKRLVVSPEQVSLKWLRSQLAHYALKLSGNKDELEDRLKKAIRDGKLKTQPKELREMEKGLKTAYEARVGSSKNSRGKIEKKKAPAAAPSKAAATASSSSSTKREPPDVAKKPAPAKKKKKGDAALHAAIAAATRKSHPGPSLKPLGPTAPKPRVSFADNLLGSYSVSCSSFLNSDSSLNLYRHSLEPKLTGALDLGDGTIHALCTLDWMPMAKQSRVPFSADGRKGEMEFSVDKGVVRVKGKIEGGPWGEIEFVGLKKTPGLTADCDGDEGEMDFGW